MFVVNLNKKINNLYFLKCKKQILKKGEKEKLTDTPIKCSFNATQVTFNLYKNEDGNVTITTEQVTINQRRQLPYIERYLKECFKGYLTIEVVDYEYKSFTASIPFATALEHAEEQQAEGV